MFKKLLRITIFVLILVMIFVCFSVAASANRIESGRKTQIDVTNKDDGFVRIRTTESISRRVRVRITKPGSIDYVYDLDENGEWEIFSLQSGDGEYTITVLENVTDTRYSPIQTAKVNVRYNREHAPFLIPIQNVMFTNDCVSITKARELNRNAANDLERVERIYRYIVENITYDVVKANKVLSGEITEYIPDINYTFNESKGICFDFSSLFAAMLRSQGIPTKLIMGYVAVNPGPVYHAWNEVYIKDVGWIRIRSNISFDGKSWSRMDSTFASSNAGGWNTEFISDDSNYQTHKEF